MHRGLEIGRHLRPGLANEEFVAEAIPNLAAFRLQQERGEPLVWQMLRVELSGSHHYRLVIRHPDRLLDLGIALDRAVDDRSEERKARGKRFRDTVRKDRRHASRVPLWLRATVPDVS